MVERCPHCQAVLRRATIGGQVYCRACGENTDQSVAQGPKGMDIASALKAKSVAKPPVALVAPIGTRTTSDVARRKAAVSARPAAELHQRTTGRSGLVDLRAAKPATMPVSKQPIATPKPENVNATQTRTPKIPRSHHISRFNTGIASSKTEATAHQKQPVLPPHAETKHEALGRLIDAHIAPTERTISKKRLVVGAAVIAVMSGYIWLQNYPKLELRSASQHAGFALNLPSYLPASYNLSGPIQASNGLATLSFASPSAAVPLQITQRSTDWDSKSLLDNVITPQSNNYVAVQGQGLTIYFWNNNQVAWVNHGIWYSIAGASNLSRAQLLKIAYSL